VVAGVWVWVWVKVHVCVSVSVCVPAFALCADSIVAAPKECHRHWRYNFRKKQCSPSYDLGIPGFQENSVSQPVRECKTPALLTCVSGEGFICQPMGEC